MALWIEVGSDREAQRTMWGWLATLCLSSPSIEIESDEDVSLGEVARMIAIASSGRRNAFLVGVVSVSQ